MSFSGAISRALDAPFSASGDVQREWLVAGSYFLLLTLVFCWPVVFAGQSFFAFDILNQFLPWGSGSSPAANNMLISDPLVHILPANQLTHEAFEDGYIPFWNPWLLAGMPFEPTTHPIQMLLLYFLDPLRAHDLNLVIHLFASGALFHYWSRQRGYMFYAALFGGTAWMFNGYLMVWFEWEFVTMNAAMLPLVLITLERCRKAATAVNVSLLGVSIALAINVGFYQLTAYCAVFLLVWVSHEQWRATGNTPRIILARYTPLLVASMIALVIALPYFIPKINAMLWSEPVQRPAFSFDEIRTLVSLLAPSHLLLMLFPDLFSNPAGPVVLPFPGGQTHLYNNFNELCLYAGLPVAALLCCGLAFWRHQDVQFFGVFAVLVLLMLSGTVLYYPLYQLPGMDFTTPNRLLFIFSFCICGLATALFHYLFTAGRRPAPVLGGLLGGIILVSLLSLWLLSGQGLTVIYPALDPDTLAELQQLLLARANVITTPLVIFVVSASLIGVTAVKNDLKKAAAPMLITLLAGDLILFGTGYNTTGSNGGEATGLPGSPAIRFLQEHRLQRPSQPFRTGSYQTYFLHNYLETHRLEDIGGYQSVFPKSYAEFIQLSQPHDGFMPAAFSRWLSLDHLGHPLLSMAGLKFFVAPAGAGLTHQDFTEVYRNEVSVFENRSVFDRVYYVCNATYPTSRESLFTALANTDIETLRTEVFLTGNGTDSRSDQCDSTVELTPLPDGTLDISLTAEQAGYLVIANQFDHRWQLASGDHVFSLLRANHTFMAAGQPAGSRELKLSYQPTWERRSYLWALGIWILLALAGAGALTYRLTR